jgi:hypothetical protein
VVVKAVTGLVQDQGDQAVAENGMAELLVQEIHLPRLRLKDLLEGIQQGQAAGKEVEVEVELVVLV